MHRPNLRPCVNASLSSLHRRGPGRARTAPAAPRVVRFGLVPAPARWPSLASYSPLSPCSAATHSPEAAGPQGGFGDDGPQGGYGGGPQDGYGNGPQDGYGNGPRDGYGSGHPTTTSVVGASRCLLSAKHLHSPPRFPPPLRHVHIEEEMDVEENDVYTCASCGRDFGVRFNWAHTGEGNGTPRCQCCVKRHGSSAGP